MLWLDFVIILIGTFELIVNDCSVRHVLNDFLLFAEQLGDLLILEEAAPGISLDVVDHDADEGLGRQNQQEVLPAHQRVSQPHVRKPH